MWALFLFLFLIGGIFTLSLCKAAARGDMQRYDAAKGRDDWQDA